MIFKKGVLKIQEMAFVLVAFMIFFVLVGLFFIVIQGNGLNEEVSKIKNDQAKASLREVSGKPELFWGGCANCIDGDKVIAVKSLILGDEEYATAWDFDYLALEILYPARPGGECNNFNYPNCNITTIIRESEDYGIAESTFVSICHWNSELENVQCDLGKVYASAAGDE